jgi:hypothetical protein
MISIILLNWKRPLNIKNKILPILEHNNMVDEIIISHGNKGTIFKYISQKKKIIHRDDSELNNKYGLSLRFLCALTCKNKYVLFMDDDEIIYNEEIYKYYKLLVESNYGIVGKYGRKLYKNHDNKFQYNFHNTIGICDVILTKFMILKKQIIYDFFNYSYLVHDIQQYAKPLWNGEDIFISLIARKRYGNHCLYSNRNIKGQKLDEMGVSVSSWNNHKQFREDFYNKCLNILKIN